MKNLIITFLGILLTIGLYSQEPEKVQKDTLTMPDSLIVQTKETKILNEFVGDWFVLSTIDQPGVRSINFDNASISFQDAQTIVSKFKNHNMKFILTFVPESQQYAFTYSYTQMMAKKPLLSLNEIPLNYTEEDGFTGHITTEKENVKLEVTIKKEGENISYRIEAQEGSKNSFLHNLNFSKPKSKE